MAHLSASRSPHHTKPGAVNTTLPTMHAILLQRLDREGRDSLLGYDRERHDLKVIDWPIGDDGRLLCPTQWDQYRRSFYYPSCLCPIFGVCTEQDVVVQREGVECIATCAKDLCGYRVRLSPLYLKPGLPAKIYPMKAAILTRAQLRRKAGYISWKDAQTRHVPNIEREGTPPVPPVPKNAWLLLDKLQAMRSPGLTPEQFQALLAQCPACEMIIARRSSYEAYESAFITVIPSEQAPVYEVKKGDADAAMATASLRDRIDRAVHCGCAYGGGKEWAEDVNKFAQCQEGAQPERRKNYRKQRMDDGQAYFKETLYVLHST
ncbi:hypothetical protein BV25DRAFT_1918950 [Artomyces pyxidatus]|uniref:Uncharacterized protein n=1 Tax=Artomyces pyxidatus TaxID=48021 RepID=A0ACB8SQR3_9AGAM|nr:hypothetical protein BV25DRAFT_1918950 [Artomyces pyxidatus]